MLQLPAFYTPSIFGDEIVLRSIDWLENLPWNQENTVRLDKNIFEICVNVKDFAPDDIEVAINDGLITVEAKHNEKQDEYGYISRQFKRRFNVPEGCKIDAVQSKVSRDGVLTITVPVIAHDTVIPVKRDTSTKSKL